MSELKTKPTEGDVSVFIDGVTPEWKRDDSREILKLMKKITGLEPKMWGPSIIGFGSYHYKYKSGREGDWFLTGFSPRKQNMTIYLVGGFADSESLLEKLGKHKISVGCLYFKKLEDIDLNILEKLIIKSIEALKEHYKEFN